MFLCISYDNTLADASLSCTRVLNLFLIMLQFKSSLATQPAPIQTSKHKKISWSINNV